jgi:signal transduction histidine kinase
VLDEALLSGSLSPASSTTPAAQPEINILVVDDRPENLLAMEVALRDPTYRLVQASSGREALQQVRERDFAVILLDVQMPIMDGFAAAKLIRKEPRARLTPIIFITANHGSEYHERLGYEAGAVDYLFKPLNVGILRAKVSIFVDLFRKNREIQQQAMLICARDEFLSIASHELKTPITPLSLQMQSFIGLIESGNLEKVPRDKLQRMLKNSYDQVERLTRLIDDLLDVSRISSGKLSLHCQRMSLADLVHSVVEGFSLHIQKAGCSLSVEVDPAAVGYWDRFRVEQVLINLLTNALKYGAGKPVDISVRVVGQWACLSVRDRGIGIARADHPRVFERFERAVSSRHFGGLGLGLYIASQIVKLHEGEIIVDSDLGAGACFTVRLPMGEEDGGGEPEGQGEEEDGGGRQ